MIEVAIKELNSLGIFVAPFFVEEEQFIKNNRESIIYEYSNKSKNNFILYIKVISNSLIRCLEIDDLIKDKFISNSDKTKISGFTCIKYEGGEAIRDIENNCIQLFLSLSFFFKGE